MANISFPCPKCQAKLKAPSERAGARSKCPRCSCPVQVPQLPADTNRDVRDNQFPSSEENRRALVPYSKKPIEVILDVLPADDIPEVIPVDEPIPTVIPVRLRMDKERKYYLINCPYCERELRIRKQDAGKVLSCPSCRLFYLSPGKRRQSGNDGLPVEVRVSAYVLKWPLCCPCCLSPHDTFIPISHTRINWAYVSTYGGIADFLASLVSNTEQRHWNVPYCWDCIEHVRTKREHYMKRECCNVEEAVNYAGWEGSFHAFKFYHWKYASLFMVQNRDKCLI